MLLVAEVSAAIFDEGLPEPDLPDCSIWRCLSTAAVIWSRLAELLLPCLCEKLLLLLLLLYW